MEIEELLDKEIDLDFLLRNLDFDDKDIVRAARRQPKLMLKASLFYKQMARERTAVETEFDLLKSELAAKIRDDVRIKSEGHLKELLIQSKRYRKMKARLDRAKDIEDAAESIKNAYTQRATMLRVSSDVINSELQTGSRLLDRVKSMDNLRSKMRKRYGD